MKNNNDRSREVSAKVQGIVDDMQKHTNYKFVDTTEKAVGIETKTEKKATKSDNKAKTFNKMTGTKADKFKGNIKSKAIAFKNKIG